MVILKKRLTMRPQVVLLAIDVPHNSYSGCERIKDDVTVSRGLPSRLSLHSPSRSNQQLRCRTRDARRMRDKIRKEKEKKVNTDPRP